MALEKFYAAISQSPVFKWMRKSFDDYLVILRKNIRIRRRRYMAFMLEMLFPILVAILLVVLNNDKRLLRYQTLEALAPSGIDENGTLPGFFDMSTGFTEKHLLDYTLCSLPTDPKDSCMIGYIAADDATIKAIFNSPKFLAYFPNKTRFVRFQSEESIQPCLKDKLNCKEIKEVINLIRAEKENDIYELQENLKLGFRGVVVFQTSVDDPEVRYKIRLMERSYGSLRHVLKTKTLLPSIYDRRDYGVSYLETGFLSLQLIIDRMIILHIKDQIIASDPTALATDIIFDVSTECTCKVVMNEIPHLKSDRFIDSDDPFGISMDYEDYSVTEANELVESSTESESQLRDQEFFETEHENQVNKQQLIVSTILVLSFTVLLVSEQRRITSGKENGLTILLLVAGMTHRSQWMGNLIAITVSYLFPITIVVLLLTARFNSTEGAIFEYTGGSVLWLLFVVYVMALGSACYLVAIISAKSTGVIALTLSIFITTFIAAVYHIDYYFDGWPTWAALLVCLHPCIALQMGLRLLVRFEMHNISTGLFAIARVIPTDPLRVITIVYMLIFDTIIYMTLTVYLDRIFKTKHGVKKSWYYLFNPSEYKFSNDHNKVAPVKMVSSTMISEMPGFEPSPEDAEPSVITTNLTKKYGNVVAVSNLSFELCHGEIFALLGHNGAGKSTLLNLLSGFTSPTSGNATIYGYDIQTQMTHIQRFTGMCPQSICLYEDLTPLEHLLIFGRLRGLHGSDAYDHCYELLEKLGIHEMAHWAARKLSNGDRRKLSMAIAIVGNPKIICLDEPTCDLDYYSRRTVWDVLLKIRVDHTIIFSTHDMNEAELLADRIGILASGKLEVCGSQTFIRHYLDLGYSLKIKMDPHKKPVPQEILKVVRGSMSKASLSILPVSPDPDLLCTFNLPEEGYTSENMSSLFIDLYRLKDVLGIIGFTVSNATLEECFLELARRLNPTVEEAVAIQAENDDDVNMNMNTVYDDEDREEEIREMFRVKHKFFSKLTQFGFLFKKRVLYSWRNKKFFIFQFVLPVLIYGIATFRVSTHNDLTGRSGPPLELTLDKIKGIKTLYHASDDTFITPVHLTQVIGASATLTKMSDPSSDYITMDYMELRNRHYVGVSAETGSQDEMSVYYSPYIQHSAPIALSIYSNSLVNYMDSHRRIITTNHPLQNPYFTGPSFEEDPYASDVYAMLTTLATIITVSFCTIYPLEEQLSGVKHLQMMAGTSSLMYWYAIFTCDLFVLTMEGTILWLISIIYKPQRIYVAHSIRDKTGIGIGLIFFSFVYSGLMLSYVMSQFARSRSGALATLLTVGLFFGLILPFVINGLGESYTTFDDSGILWLFRLIPAYAIGSSERKYLVTKLGNARCDHFTDLGETNYCSTDHLNIEEKRKVSCCRNCPEIFGSGHCYDREELTRFPWDDNHRDDDSPYHPVLAKHGNRRIFYEIVSMIVTGVLLNVFVVFLDSDKYRRLSSWVKGLRPQAFQTNVEDDDVLDEMDLVERMVDDKQTEEEALMTHNLCKSYGTFPALHNVSFRVHLGEAFGIIGVNGAGKSTLYGLITGSKTQTYGNVYSINCNLNSSRYYLMQKMGYLPQKGIALFQYMTCLENLVHFGRLRKLSVKEARKAGEELLKTMLLDKFTNTLVRNLSEGTRRRLGTAMAIVGAPPIILLDEPTSASDPGSRRAFWKIIKELKKKGHTVVLGSHRIQECEELCDRIAIMVDGKFVCIGSPNHLRETFGNGWKLLVKLIPGPAESQGYVSSLSEAIETTFEPCTLRDRRRNVIQYVIHDASVSWDYLFQMMEHIKLRYNDLVEDYAFSNTTLHEVFLSFVVLQNCGRILDASGSEGCGICC